MPDFYPVHRPVLRLQLRPREGQGPARGSRPPDGFTTILAYNAGDPIQEPIAILYQTALREIGVDLELKKLPAATFFDAVSKRKQPMIFYLDARGARTSATR